MSELMSRTALATDAEPQMEVKVVSSDESLVKSEKKLSSKARRESKTNAPEIAQQPVEKSYIDKFVEELNAKKIRKSHISAPDYNGPCAVFSLNEKINLSGSYKKEVVGDRILVYPVKE